MIVYIRTDASLLIGSGHVMRCLTLANRLRRRPGTEVVFLCREHPGHMIPYLRSRGYPVEALPHGEAVSALPVRPDSASAAAGWSPRAVETFGRSSAEPGDLAHEHWLGAHWSVDAEQTIQRLHRPHGPADWLVVDHYALDFRYEEKVRPHVGKLMAIDDLADRPHLCDVLLDQNLDAEAGARYDGLTPPGAKLLTGPRYALLREEFAAARPFVRRDGAVRNVLISFGGVDAAGETGKALTALAPLAAEGLVQLTVLAGRANPHREAIASLCASLPDTRCFDHVENVAQLMLESDLAVGAGGSSTWERCCLGLPALTVAAAANQEALSERAARAGAVVYLGKSAVVTAPRMREAVHTMRQNPSKMLWMSARAMELTDGRGTERTVEEVFT